MIEFTFILNSEPLSVLTTGSSSYPAFSGAGADKNKKTSQCISGSGPIPTGTYYIFDRQSGGLLGPLRDFFSGKDQWFALYAIDKAIDDEVYCNKVKRGQFRLHPKGPLGISQGCIVIDNPKDFATIRSKLKNTSKIKVPGLELEAYGKVVVK